MEARDRWLVAWGLGYVAVGTASLLVPLYAVALGGGAFVVGLLAATAAFAAVPGAVLWGWLADRTGRRRVFVVVALAATAAVLAAVPLVRTTFALVLLNTLLWFVVSAAAPVLTLLAVAGTPSAAWEARIGALNAWQGYGWVGGLLLGSLWLPVAGGRLGPATARTWLFWLAAVAAAAGAAGAVRTLPRERRVRPERLLAAPELLAGLDRGAGRYVRAVPFATTRLYWAIRSLRPGRLPTDLGGYLVAVGVFSAGFGAFWAPLPAYLAAAYPDERVFWFFLATNVAAAVAYGRVGRWSATRGSRRLQQDALAARGVLFPAVAVLVGTLAAPVELPALLVVFGLIGLTWAVIAVTASGLVTRLAGAAPGSALGLYAAVAGAGGGVGSLLGGWLAEVSGFLVTFVAAGGLVLASVLLVAAVVTRHGSSSA